MKLFYFFSFLLISLFSFNSCGYHIGSIGHPQIKTIAIGEAKNDTIEPNVSAIIRQLCAEQFQVDGTYKLTEIDSADCIVYVRISEAKFTGNEDTSLESGLLLNHRTWSLILKGEVTVIIPGRTTPLIDRRSVSGSTSYQVLYDDMTHRRAAIESAGREMARQIVSAMTEGW